MPENFRSPTPQEMAQEMGLSDADVAQRLTFVGFNHEDSQRIPQLDSILEANIEPLISEFFNFMSSITAAESMMTDPSWIKKAHDLKAAHLREMVKGRYDLSYALDRLSLALLYSGVGLDMRVFLGAYHCLLKKFGKIVMAHWSKDPEEGFEIFMALKKIAFFDIGIVLDVLALEHQRRLRDHENKFAKLDTQFHDTQQMEFRFRTLVEKSAEIITMRNAQGGLLYASASMERTMGFSFEEVRDIDFGELIHPEDRHEALAAFSKLQPSQSVQGLRMRVKAKDGSWHSLEGSLSNFLDDPAIAAVVASFRDVSTRVKVEEQLAQAVKMEGVGRLAAGIAHDFNNIVNVITGYSEEAMDALKGDESGRKLIQPIAQAAKRAALLTRQLLAFSRTQVLKPQVLNLNKTVEDISSMLTRVLGEDIEVVVKPGLGLDLVFIDPGQLEQIIMNLAVNSKDAMPEGGKLVIETSNVALNEEYILSHGEGKAGPHVMIAVTDTGIGMDAPVRAKIFEPFFTTKAVGSGTGLGLSTVYGIVKQSGGNIWVYSEPGVGTCFKVYLPRHEGTVLTQVEPPPSAIEGGHETILLVEDEKALRDLFRMVLTNYGYQVLDTGDAFEALEIFREKKDTIDLLLTDMIMPKMGGRALAERITAMRNDVKVAFMSGYTDDAVVKGGMLSAGSAFIEKPISKNELLRKVRSILTSP
jgi:two-component system cell cycle sensor histidine kinase/response regulator CckA